MGLNQQDGMTMTTSGPWAILRRLLLHAKSSHGPTAQVHQREARYRRFVPDIA